MFDVRGRLLYFITQSVEESVVYYRVRHTFHTLSDRTCASEVRKRISMCMSVQSLLQNPQQPWLSLACTPNKKKSVKVSAFFPHYHSEFKEGFRGHSCGLVCERSIGSQTLNPQGLGA